MHKGASSKQQHLNRAGSFSTRGSGRGLDLLGLGAGVEESIDPEQRQQILRAKLQQNKDMVLRLNDRMTNRLPRNTYLAVHSERKQLQAQNVEIEQELRAIKNTLVGSRNADLGNFILEVCQETMTKPQWAAIRAEAERRQAAVLQKEENVLHD